MAEQTTVIEHLMQGRQALEREVTRLTDAMAQLDSVIALFESGGASSALPGTSPLVRSVASGATSATVSASTEPRAPRRPVKKPTRPKRELSAAGDGPKSIREHVLDMLASENRDFGLAEIIDRVHGLGIQAHDDAVRSITIKLMKDGQVERVGRGQYRLAGAARSRADASTAPAPVSNLFDDSSAEAAPADAANTDTDIDNTRDIEGAEFDTADAGTVDTAGTENVDTESIDTENVDTENVDSADATGSDGVPQDTTESDEPAANQQPEPQRSSYSPPLNLGQPWN